MIVVPIKTGRGLNSREHWRARAKRVFRERMAVQEHIWVEVLPRPVMPCSVRLTRVAPSNGLDSDNLAGSLKACRDETAAWLGIDDRDPRVQWLYDQRRGPWAVEIEFGKPQVAPKFEALCDVF